MLLFSIIYKTMEALYPFVWTMPATKNVPKYFS